MCGFLSHRVVGEYVVSVLGGSLGDGIADTIVQDLDADSFGYFILSSLGKLKTPKSQTLSTATLTRAKGQIHLPPPLSLPSQILTLFTSCTILAVTYATSLIANLRPKDTLGPANVPMSYHKAIPEYLILSSTKVRYEDQA